MCVRVQPFLVSQVWWQGNKVYDLNIAMGGVGVLCVALVNLDNSSQYYITTEYKEEQ